MYTLASLVYTHGHVGWRYRSLFAEYSLFYRALLQNRPIISRSLRAAMSAGGVCPQTEEIGLKIITTAKNSNKFSRESPYISNTFSRQSPNLPANLHANKWSPRHSKDLTGKLLDLEIQIF